VTVITVFSIPPAVHLEHDFVVVTVTIALWSLPPPGAVIGIGGTRKGAAQLALLVILATFLLADLDESGLAVAFASGHIAIRNIGILHTALN
jgi:hypothetical protein